MKTSVTGYTRFLKIVNPIFFALSLLMIILPTMVSAQNLEQRKKNVKAFTELCGYVRFFHPSSESQRINWSLFTLYGTDKVLQAKNNDSLIVIMKDLFKYISPSVYIGKQPVKNNLIIQNITPGELITYKKTKLINRGLALPNGIPIYKSQRLNIDTLEKDFDEYPVAALSLKNYRGKDFEFSIELQGDSSDCFTNTLPINIVHPDNAIKFVSVQKYLPEKNSVFKFSGKIPLQQDTVNIILRISKTRRVSVKKPQITFSIAGAKKTLTFDQAVSNSKITHTNSRIFIDVGDRILFRGQDPKIEDMINRQLIKGVFCTVPKTLYAVGKETYPHLDTAVVSSFINRLRSFYRTKNDDYKTASRISNAIVLSNVLRYGFPYWDDVSGDYEDVYKELMRKAMLDKTNEDFLNTLQTTASKMNDGHMFVSYSGNDRKKQKSISVSLEKIDNEIVVKHVLDPMFKKLTSGIIIDSIDGEPADAIYARRYKLVSGSPQWRNYKVLLGFFDSDKDSVSIVVRNNNKREIIKGIRSSEQLEYRPQALDKYVPKDGLIKERVFYYNLTKDSVLKKIEDSITTLSQAKAIIFDMRGYPAENINNIIGHLLKCVEHTKWMNIPLIEDPLKANANISSGWDLSPINPFLKGKIIFLSDACSQSYAESILGYIKGLKLGLIVGRPTSGANGDMQNIYLLDDFRVFYSGTKVTNPDGTKNHMIGIKPDFEVQVTKSGLAQGRDEILEKAIKIADQNE
ncbi:S41 family peptidase [Pedobacter gandavensis]|uniref:S41 family peptidase n=1 Tax=Pedobacter gandavensis TaxID=2679963 RepID=UPI0029313BE5|nr:S41 family peptidase [Pedobacter gandavensis]